MMGSKEVNQINIISLQAFCARNNMGTTTLYKLIKKGRIKTVKHPDTLRKGILATEEARYLKSLAEAD